jgi:hypothetical protein
MEEDSDGDSAHAVISFADASGHTVQFTDAVAQNPPEFHSGDAVNVIYLANDPEKSAIVDRGVSNYLGPVVMLFFGTVFSVVGVLLVRRNRRDAENKQV